MAKVVLIVDDCEDIADACGTMLRRFVGCDVTLASDGEEGLASVAARRPDVVILDMMMPGLDGLGFLERLPKLVAVPPPVIAYSGFDKFEALAMARGAAAFVQKPFEFKTLADIVREFLDGRQAPMDVREARASEVMKPAQAAARETFWRDAPAATEPLRCDLARLVRGTAGYFGVARAFVTALHEGRLRVLAEHGASRQFPVGCAMDPRLNFCPDVIAASTPLLLVDSSASPAFSSHPAAAAGVRFYAGAPLVSADGVALGTFCLEHSESRPFAAEDLALVRHFARCAGVAIECDARGEPWTPLYADDGVVHPIQFEVVLEAEMRRAERDDDAVELVFLGCAADAVLASAIARALDRGEQARTIVAMERVAIAPHPGCALVMVGVLQDCSAVDRMDAIVRAVAAPLLARIQYRPRSDTLMAAEALIRAGNRRASDS